MAYTLDRNEAALRLGVSTRTIDRHIQNGRIRTRRIGKKMFLEEVDVELLHSDGSLRQEDEYEVITNSHSDDLSGIITIEKTEPLVSPDVQMAITELSRIYTDAQAVITQKDNTIKELSYKVGKMETELANSVNAAEYRQTAYMLETEKNRNSETVKQFGDKISHLEKEVQKRNSFIIGLAMLFVVLLISIVIFFLYRHLI